MRTPMTDAEKADARREYLADPSVSVRELADEFGVSTSAMLRALRGVTRPPGGQVKATMTTDQMVRMYHDQGFTLREIGRQSGLTESGVWRRINGNRVKVSV
jgi:hypothetical protein